MKTLILGKTGQVGRQLNDSLHSLGKVFLCGREEVNFEYQEQLYSVVQSVQPDIIVNAVAYTSVDQAESERELSTRVNTTAVGELAQYANEYDALLVHYSTDYVFDGNKSGRYGEEDITNPQSVYGQTKLDGENLIRESGCKHLIFRTSWVYSDVGNNFMSTILNLASKKTSLNVIDDQIGSPTSAKLIAQVTAQVLNSYIEDQIRFQPELGTYHLSASGETSWHEYAKTIIDFASLHNEELVLSAEAIFPVSSSEYPQIAIRPKNSLLDTSKLTSQFDVTLPNWKENLHQIMSSLFTCHSEV